MFEGDDYPDPEPPSPQRIARRGLVLAAVVCRSALEDSAGDPKAEAFRRDVVAWLDAAGAVAEAEPGEASRLQAPLGTLTERQVIDASWRGEGLGVLAWALGRCELPAYDTTVKSPDVADRLGFMERAGSELVREARLRDPHVIEQLADRLLALHWRLREFSLRPAAMDFVAFARTAYFGPQDVEGLRLAANDLAIHGRPLMDVPERRWRECLSIARERQQAANWLAGQQVLYSEVTCDT